MAHPPPASSSIYYPPPSGGNGPASLAGTGTGTGAGTPDNYARYFAGSVGPSSATAYAASGLQGVPSQGNYHANQQSGPPSIIPPSVVPPSIIPPSILPPSSAAFPHSVRPTSTLGQRPLPSAYRPVRHISEEERETWIQPALRKKKYERNTGGTQLPWFAEYHRAQNAPAEMRDAIGNVAKRDLAHRPELFEGRQFEPTPGSAQALIRSLEDKRRRNAAAAAAADGAGGAIQGATPQGDTAHAALPAGHVGTSQPQLLLPTGSQNYQGNLPALEAGTISNAPLQVLPAGESGQMVRTPGHEVRPPGHAYFPQDGPIQGLLAGPPSTAYAGLVPVSDTGYNLGASPRPGSSVSQRPDYPSGYNQYQIIPLNPQGERVNQYAMLTSPGNRQALVQYPPDNYGRSGASQALTPYTASTAYSSRPAMSTARDLPPPRKKPRTYQRYDQFADHEYLMELERSQAGRGMPCFCCE